MNSVMGEESVYLMVMSHRTSDNYACANDSAHKRKYDAVLLIAPRQNSMVWMDWCVNSSQKSKAAP